MSEYGDIETAVVAVLAALEEGGSPLFAEVSGGAFADRKSRDAQLLRAATPAAVVVVDGRQRVGADDAVPGAVRVTVAVTDRSLRSSVGARLGDVDGHGVYLVAERVAGSLTGAVLGDAWRLSEIEERVVTADERQVVIEQSWIADKPVSLTLPTFAGDNILGSDAVVSVMPGKAEAEAVDFSFPGVDGVFRHVLGRTSREIVWRGVLRAASHVELSAIEDGIEALIGSGQVGVVADALGRSFAGCVVSEFERRGERRVHPATGQVVQAFSLLFTQLAGQG
ncbi:MAG: hypothetical protein H6817_00335 [Phycisphaerales bacterium]|nr:hypothetical protein [Phycisphaerales bacterium]